MNVIVYRAVAINTSSKKSVNDFDKDGYRYQYNEFGTIEQDTWLYTWRICLVRGWT